MITRRGRRSKPLSLTTISVGNVPSTWTALDLRRWLAGRGLNVASLERGRSAWRVELATLAEAERALDGIGGTFDVRPARERTT